MKTYLVVWKIDIEADSPQEAALQAQIAQRDPESGATYFDVEDEQGVIVTVDLEEEV